MLTENAVRRCNGTTTGCRELPPRSSERAIAIDTIRFRPACATPTRRASPPPPRAQSARPVVAAMPLAATPMPQATSAVRRRPPRASPTRDSASTTLETAKAPSGTATMAGCAGWCRNLPCRASATRGARSSRADTCRCTGSATASSGRAWSIRSIVALPSRDRGESRYRPPSPPRPAAKRRQPGRAHRFRPARQGISDHRVEEVPVMSTALEGAATAPIGQRRWAIAEGYIPGSSTGPEPQFTSHETACLLNAGDRDAHVTITVYFTDREPQGPYRLVVPARRTHHQRFNDLEP